MMNAVTGRRREAATGRVVAVGAIVILLAWSGPPSDVLGGPADAQRRAAKRQLDSIQRLVRRYDKVRDKLDEPGLQQRERLIAEAIKTGPGHAAAVLRLVESEGQVLFQRYQAAFTALIQPARRVDAATVLAENPSLGQARRLLFRYRTWSRQLRDAARGRIGGDREQARANPAEANPWNANKAEANPRNANQAAEPEPGKPLDESAVGDPGEDDDLAKVERGLVRRWLVLQGLGQLTPTEVQVVRQVNSRRHKKGLGPLEVDFMLCLVARDHCRDMIRKHFFAHRSKLPGKTTFMDRARRFGTSAIAENLASCPNVATAMSLWMASTGHRRNILDGSATRVGIGSIGRKYTLMFGR